jgi:hypothetical protein
MLESLILVREARTAAERASFYRAIANGGLVRVVRGVGAPLELWRGWSQADRYRARIHAVAATTSQRLVFSHAAAAALWRMPWFGSRPATVDATFAGDAGRSTSLIRAHGLLSDVTTIDGLLVTPLARTVVDVARSCALETAVVVADSVLAARRSDDTVRPETTTRPDLLDECEWVPRSHGGAKARTAIEFADAASGSPGESVSRVSMWRIGAPTPILQQRFPAPHGEWFVDYWWPDFGLIGEFDGIGKYLRDPAPGSVADAIVAGGRVARPGSARHTVGVADRLVAREASSAPRRGGAAASTNCRFLIPPQERFGLRLRNLQLVRAGATGGTGGAAQGGAGAWSALPDRLEVAEFADAGCRELAAVARVLHATEGELGV